MHSFQVMLTRTDRQKTDKQTHNILSPLFHGEGGRVKSFESVFFSPINLSPGLSNLPAKRSWPTMSCMKRILKGVSVHLLCFPVIMLWSLVSITCECGQAILKMSLIQLRSGLNYTIIVIQ